MADGMPGEAKAKRRVSLVFFDAGGGHRNAATALQVQIELQADCFAGLWANRERKNSEKTKLPFLEPGDVDQAMQTASAIGDDRVGW